MQVTCNHCNRKLDIPEEKVPAGQAFNLTCPGCKNKFRVDSHLEKAELYKPEEENRVDEYQSVDTTLMFTDAEFDTDEEVFEIYDENDQVALILDPKFEDAWSSALSGLEFKLQTANSPEHAVHKLKFSSYNVVILHETYGETTLETSPIYNYIVQMPMSSRRKIFVVLVGKEFKSTDNMEAFAHSVNLVVNERDIDKLDMILKKSINENNIFYKIYRDTLQSLGKF